MRNTPPQEYVEAIGAQLMTGARLVLDMLDRGDTPSFYEWHKLMTGPGSPSFGSVNDLQLIWVWDSLRKSPLLEEALRPLSPAGMLWNRESEPITVLRKESWLCIALQFGETHHLLRKTEYPPVAERAVVHLLEDLQLRPGRQDRLECCDCRCDLTLRVPDTFAPERELDMLGVHDDKLLHLGHGLLRVRADSLNHAYTIASRRLEPGRRTHGGSAYTHLVFVDKDRRILLEDIRIGAEHGWWPAST
jgi:hypothetical protein